MYSRLGLGFFLVNVDEFLATVLIIWAGWFWAAFMGFTG
jgi:hypothetical protein